MGAAAEEVDRAEDGTISDLSAFSTTVANNSYFGRRGGNLWLELELSLV